MTIRRATADDVTALGELTQREHGHSRFAHTPFDVQVVHARFAGAIANLTSVVFVSETEGQIDGVIAGAIQPNLHNRFATVYELLLYSEGRQGLRLLDALKEWANTMRATALVVHNYAGIKAQDTFNQVMQRRGFDLLGQSYTTRLEN